MLDQHIEAVFENGVFRPLQPIHFPEHQRVTLVLPATPDVAIPAEDDELTEEVGYTPLPLQECTRIRVRLTPIGELPPLPYPVDANDLERE